MGHRARVLGRRCWTALSLAALSVLGPSTVRAELVTWDNSAGDSSWSMGTPTNWDLDQLPTSADTAVFGDNGAGAITVGLLPSASSPSEILLQNAIGTYEFTGSGLWLNRITQTGNSSTFRVSSLNANTAGLTLDVQANTLTIDAPVLTTDLTKTGAGTLVLQRSTSITGSTYVQDGLLVAGALGAAGTNVFLDGGDVQFDAGGYSASNYTVRKDATLTVNSGLTTSVSLLTIDDAKAVLRGINGLDTTSSGTIVNGTGLAALDAGVMTRLGRLTLNHDLTLSGSAPVVAGPLAGSGTLRTTASMLTLSSTHSGFTGSLIVDGGMTTITGYNAAGGRPVTVHNEGVVSVTGGGTLLNCAVVLNDTSQLHLHTGSGLNLATVAVNDQARVVATSSNALFKGTIRLNGGTLELSGSNSSYGGSIEVPVTSAIESTAAGGPATSSIGDLRLGDATLLVRGNASHTLSTATLTVNGTGLARAEAGVKELAFGPVALNADLTLDGAGSFSMNALSGSGSLTKLGAGGLRLKSTAQTSQTGALLVEEGIVTLADTQAFRGPIVVNDGGMVALSVSSALAGPVTVNAGGILETGAGMGHLTNTAVTLAGGKLRMMSSVGGTVTLSASSAVDFSQAGTIGVTTLNLADHALTVGGPAGTFTATTVTTKGPGQASVSAPDAQLNWTSLTVDAGLSLVCGDSTFNTLAGTGTLTLDAPSVHVYNAANFNGLLVVNSGEFVMGSGSGGISVHSAVTANNAATIRAGGAFSFAGATMTLNGTSQFKSNPDALNGGSVTVNPGAIVNATASNTLRDATVRLAGGRALVGSFSGGRFHILADSAIEMSSANKVQSIAMGDSALTIGGVPALLEGPLTVEGTGLAKLIVPGAVSFNPVALGADLTIDGAGSTKLAGLSGTGMIIKQGAGTLELLAPIDAGYSGGLRILDGTVKLSLASAIKGELTLDAGKLSAAVADALSGSTITVKPGGTLESAATSGLRGASIFLDGGILRLAAPGVSGGDVTLLQPALLDASGTQGINSLTMGDQTLTIPSTTQFSLAQGITVNGMGAAKVVGGTAALTLGRLTLNDDLDIAATGTVSVGPLGGTGTLTSGSARFVSLASASGFTGQVALTGGSFQGLHAAALGTGTLVASNAAITAGAARAFDGATVVLNGTSTLTPSTSLALQGAKVILNGTTSLTATGSQGGGAEITVNPGTAAYFFITGTNDLSGALVHLAGGTTRLRSNSSFTAGGAFDVQANSTIEVRPNTSGSGNTITLGSLTLDDQTLSVTSSANYGLSAPFTINGSGQAALSITTTLVSGAFTLNDDLTVMGDAAALTVSKLLGSGTLTRRGATGVTTLASASQSFTGAFVLEAGSLGITGADALKGGSLQIAGGTATASAANALRGASVAVNGGSLALTGANAGVGVASLTVNAGGLLTVSAQALGQASVVVNPGGTLEATASFALTNSSITLAGGTLKLRKDSTASFDGSVSVTANSAVIAAQDGFASSPGHLISALSLGDHTLSVSTQGGLSSNVNFFCPSVVNIGGTGSAAISNAGGISLGKVTLADDLTLTGAGKGSLSLLAGAGDLYFNGTGSYGLRKEPSSTWSGSAIINGGSVGADTANALLGARITVNPGGTFAPSVSQSAAGAIVDLFGGTLNATSSQAMQGATVNYHSGTVIGTGGAAVNILPGATLPLRSVLAGPVTLAGGTLELVRESYAAPQNYTTAVGLSADSTIHLNNQVPGWSQAFQIYSLALGDQTLNVTASAASTLQASQTFTVTGTGKARINSAANISFGSFGTPTLSAGLTTAGAGTFSFSSLQGSGAITHMGPGNLFVANSSVYSGAITVNGGTLQGFGMGPITVNPGGRLLFNTSTPSYGGAITLAGGTLQLRAEHSHSLASAPIRTTGNSTLDIAPTINLPWTTNFTLQQLVLDGGTLTVTNSNNGQAQFNITTISAASTIDNRAAVTSVFGQEQALRLNGVALNKPLTVVGPGDTSLFRLSGPGDIVMNGTGTLVINNSRTTDNRNWAGQLLVKAGTVALRGDTNYNGLGTSTDPLTVSGGATLSVDGIGRRFGEQHAFTRAITVSGAGDDGAGALSYAPDFALMEGVIASPVTLAGPATIAVASKTFGQDLHIGDPAGNLPGGALAGVGPLTKIGGKDLLGVLRINVPASYSGGTIIEAGGIAVGSLGSLVGTGGIAVKPGAVLLVEEPAGTDPAMHSTSPQSVDLRGGALALLADLDPAPFLSPNSTGGSVAVADCGRDINFSQLLPGLPASAWKLGAASRSGGTYSGTIRFDEPSTLTLGGAGGTLTIASGLKAANNVAAIAVNGSGTYILTGPNDYAGDTTIMAGSLQVSETAVLGPSSAPICFGGTQTSSAEARLLLAPGTTFTRDIVVRDTALGASIATASGEGNSPATVTGSITVDGRLSLGNAPTDAPLAVPSAIAGAGRIDLFGGRVILSGDSTFTGPLHVYGALDASASANRALGRSPSVTVYGGGVVALKSSANYAPDALFTGYEGGVVSIQSDEAPAFSAGSTGILAIEHNGYTAVTDLSALGGGQMFLGSTTSGVFSGALLPGADTTFRLGGGGGTLSFGPNALADTAEAAMLIVGTAWSGPTGGGTIELFGDNSYTRATLIQHGVLQAGDGGRILGGSKFVTIQSAGALRLLTSNNYDPAASFTINGILSVAGQFLPTIASASDGTIAIDTDGYMALSSLATLGNGSMFLSSTTAGSISGPLAPGASNTWRFGGAGGELRVDTSLQDGTGIARSLIVGRPGATGNGTVNLAAANAFTGPITVQADADLAITGTVVSPIKLQGTGTLRLLNSQTLASIDAGSSAVEIADDVAITVQSLANGAVRSGGGTLDILSYSRTSTGALEHRAGRTFLRGNAGSAATSAAYAIARLSPDMKGGILSFLAPQDLDDLLVDEAAPLARAILGSGVELRLYGNSPSDGVDPSREMIEGLWTDVMSGYGRGDSGIDLDSAIDHSTYALGLLLAHDAKNEAHVLLKSVLHGDIDGSGAVDSADAAIMLAGYSALMPESAMMQTWLEGDLTFDGLLNEYDVGALATAMHYPYDPSAGSAAALAALQRMANVPEPSAIILLLPALLLGRKRRCGVPCPGRRG